LLTLENARTHDTVLNATFCFALLNYGPCLHYTTNIRESLPKSRRFHSYTATQLLRHDRQTETS